MPVFRKNRVLVLGLMLVLAALMAFTGCGKAAPVELNVSAAASLTDVLTELNKTYMQDHSNVTITANFGSSGTLQKQIEQGAPADVFFSAGAKQMQSLQDENLLVNDTRKDVLNNSVVLVVPSDSTLQIADFNGLLGEGIKKIAIGDPASVPAGDYAKQVLTQLGIWDQLQDKLILCTDVRQVLSYVESGDVDAGIVYATDAAISTSVKIITSGPAEINAKIIYPIAVTKSSTKLEDAKDYIAFLESAKAKTVFEKYGFTVVVK